MEIVVNLVVVWFDVIELIILKFVFLVSLYAFSWILVRSHPLMLSLLLIIFSIGVASQLQLFISSWFFYALVLIFLGGIIVIFLYFARILNSEKLMVSYNFYGRVLLFFFRVVFFWRPRFKRFNNSLLFIMNFSFLNLTLLSLLLFYLLLRLTIVVKLVDHFQGALDSQV